MITMQSVRSVCQWVADRAWTGREALAAALRRRRFQAAAPTAISFPLDRAPYIDVEVEISPEVFEGILAHVQDAWTRLGEEQPYWSVLTAERFQTARFDEHAEEFWNSGQGDVDRFLAWLGRHRLSPESYPVLLEYGCGTARTTAWLARRFQKVLACDISKSHLELAARRLQEVRARNVELALVSRDLLERLPRVDAVFSIIVLQHNPPPVMAYLLARLLRALRPAGIAFFQVPTYRCGYRFQVDRYLRAIRNGNAGMEMHVLPQENVFRIVEAEGCRVLEVQPDGAPGSAEFISNTFLVQKR